jgi:2-dehydro-3-deoxyphosphogluconate aldolase/(4S)-4-hydroxy-2-oxoglutarate aldolase
MNKAKEIEGLIQRDSFLPLFYNDNETVCLNITRALYAAGVRVIEFTNRGDNALNNFKALVNLKKTEFSDLMLGIGTIKTVSDAKAYQDAQADFLISPFFDQDISNYANENNILWIPGCMTPSEINAALKSNHQLIKLFPGSSLGASFIKAIKPLFPNAKFMVTGGVTTEKDNLNEWLSAGAIAVGLGSNLVPSRFSNEAEYENLIQNTSELKARISQLKKA